MADSNGMTKAVAGVAALACASVIAMGTALIASKNEAERQAKEAKE